MAPDFFSRKRNRGKKRRRGELLVPLSTPLQKGGLLRGPPHFLAVTCSFCGYLSCMAVQRFPHRRKAWFKWHRTGAIPPQQKFSPVAHWGECRGGSAPSALSFPPLSLAKKAVLPPSRRPVRRGQNPPRLGQLPQTLQITTRSPPSPVHPSAFPFDGPPCASPPRTPARAPEPAPPPPSTVPR